MKKVLIIKLWAFGDILMATPLLDALRRTYPGIHIAWMVDQQYSSALEGNPAIDDLQILDTGAWRRLRRKGNYPAWIRQSSQMRRAIVDAGYDAIINCHAENWWSAIFCAAPIRIGLYPTPTLPWTRRFYTHALNRPPGLHNTDHYLLTTKVLGCQDADRRLVLAKTVEEESFFQEFAQQNGLRSDRPLVLFSPFSTGENRNWELDRCAAVADWLQSRYDAQIVLTNTPADAEKANAIAADIRQRAKNRQAEASLIHPENIRFRQFISLIRHAGLVFCMDSSALHIAAAVGTPYIALFGATPTAERVPLSGRGRALFHMLPCSPCDLRTCKNPEFRACMKRISVTEVEEAIAGLFQLPQMEERNPTSSPLSFG